MSKLNGAREALAALAGAEQDERDTYSHPKPQIRFMTKSMEVWSPCGDYRDITFTEKENAPGGLSILVPDNDHWSEYFYGQNRDATRPIVIDLPGWRTLWLTVSFDRIKAGRQRYIEVSAVHCLEYLNWMRVWPDPGLPPEWQPSKWRSPIGPAATVCAQITMESLIRVQGGLHPIMTHARFYRTTDTTRWTHGNYRLDRVLDAVTEICEAEDLQIVPTLYIHGEDEQPFPQWHVLDRTTLIFDYVPRTHDKAITGTIVDGLIRTGVEIAQDLLEWVTYPILDPQDPKGIDDLTGRDGEVFPVYRTGEWSSVDEFSQTVHLPMATRITAGGKSPDWTNDIATGVVSGVVGYLGYLIGLPGLKLGFLEERVKDTILAFHSLEDSRTARAAGAWRFREAFSDSQGSGLSLQIAQTMKTTLWHHRGYTSHRIVVENGFPYLVGKHVRVGWPVGVEMPDGTVHVDRVDSISYSDSRDERGKITIQIGSGEAEQEPGLRGLTKIRRFSAWLHRVALGG